MKVMFLDEPGNHSLDTIEPRFPVFVLGGVITERDYIFDVVEPRLSEVKRTFFDRDDFVLHTVDIVRRQGPFVALKNPA